MKLSALYNEGFLEKAGKYAGKQIKKHGPGVAKTLGKTSLKALEKAGRGVVGGVGGAAKGAYSGVKS